MKPKNIKMKKLRFKPDKMKIDYILAKMSEKARDVPSGHIPPTLRVDGSDCPAPCSAVSVKDAGNPQAVKPCEAKNGELASKQEHNERLETIRKLMDCFKAKARNYIEWDKEKALAILAEHDKKQDEYFGKGTMPPNKLSNKEALKELQQNHNDCTCRGKTAQQDEELGHRKDCPVRKITRCDDDE